jgi:hypothetical protein
MRGGWAGLCEKKQSLKVEKLDGENRFRVL